MPQHSSGLRENLTTSLGVNWQKKYNNWQSFEVEKHSPYMFSAEFFHISDEVHVTSPTLTLKNSRNHSLLHVTGNFPRPGIQVGMFTFFQSSSNSIRLAFRISCAIKWLFVCNPSRKELLNGHRQHTGWWWLSVCDFSGTRMHTGIMCHAIPICIRGSISIPVCIWGSRR